MSRQPIGHHAATHLAGGEDPIEGIGGDFVFIEELAVGGTPSNLTFSSIPQTYRHLRIEANLGGDSGSIQPIIQWNGNTDAGYRTIGNFASAPGGTSVPPETFYDGVGIGVQPCCGLHVPEASLASPELFYANFIFEFPYYTAPASVYGRQSTVIFNGFANQDDNENYWTSSGGGFYPAGSGIPMTSIVLTTLSGTNLAQDSIASLYGIK